MGCVHILIFPRVIGLGGWPTMDPESVKLRMISIAIPPSPHRASTGANPNDYFVTFSYQPLRIDQTALQHRIQPPPQLRQILISPHLLPHLLVDPTPGICSKQLEIYLASLGFSPNKNGNAITVRNWSGSKGHSIVTPHDATVAPLAEALGI